MCKFSAALASENASNALNQEGYLNDELYVQLAQRYRVSSIRDVRDTGGRIVPSTSDQWLTTRQSLVSDKRQQQDCAGHERVMENRTTIDRNMVHFDPHRRIESLEGAIDFVATIPVRNRITERFNRADQRRFRTGGSFK